MACELGVREKAEIKCTCEGSVAPEVAYDDLSEQSKLCWDGALSHPIPNVYFMKIHDKTESTESTGAARRQNGSSAWVETAM